MTLSIVARMMRAFVFRRALVWLATRFADQRCHWLATRFADQRRTYLPWTRPRTHTYVVESDYAHFAGLQRSLARSLRPSALWATL